MSAESGQFLKICESSPTLDFTSLQRFISRYCVADSLTPQDVEPSLAHCWKWNYALSEVPQC
jgi:hypothetical protein